MTKACKDFPIVEIDVHGTKRKIAAALAALMTASSGALLANSNNNAQKKAMIKGKIAPSPYTVTYYTIDDAMLKLNPHIIQNENEQTLHTQYLYSNEFEVVSAGYLCDGKQEIANSQEEEKNIISRGGEPIWYGVITQNEEITYYRAEDIRRYVLAKEPEKTKKLVSH